jgi:branched-chain amino acid transport system permease protein
MIDNGLLVQMLIGALLGLSVYLPLAAGQLSLATPAFYAVGGTLAALLSTRWAALGVGGDGSLPLPSFLLELLLPVADAAAAVAAASLLATLAAVAANVAFARAAPLAGLGRGFLFICRAQAS